MWAAQCLEYDIAAQGKTIDEAKESFKRTFVGQIMVDVHFGHQPLQGIEKAPEEYWEQFRTAKRLIDREPFYVGHLPIRASAQDLRVAA